MSFAIKVVVWRLTLLVLCFGIVAHFDSFFLQQIKSLQKQNDISINNATKINLLPDCPMPDIPRMYLIHVGKAGGVTLGKSINLSMKKNALPCRMNQTLHGQDDNICYKEQNASQFSLHVISHFHLVSPLFTASQKAWLLNNTNTFLYTIRDPIDRLVSSFYYHKNGYGIAKEKNTSRAFHTGGFPRVAASVEFHETCFPGDIGDLVNVLSYKGNDTRVLSCKKLGQAVMRGENVAGGVHFNHNYQYYKHYTLGTKPNYSVAVIRMENLWDDVINLDKILGGSGNVNGVGSRHTHGSERYTSSSIKTFTKANTMYLCCLIYDEMNIYQSLVLRAFNLNAMQKEGTISKLLDHCCIDDIGILPRQIPFPWQMLYNKTDKCTNLRMLDFHIR